LATKKRKKRKKSRIDQILASACCPRQNEHIDIKRDAYNHVKVILQRCQKGQKSVVAVLLLLLFCHTFYFHAISQELFIIILIVIIIIMFVYWRLSNATNIEQ